MNVLSGTIDRLALPLSIDFSPRAFKSTFLLSGTVISQGWWNDFPASAKLVNRLRTICSFFKKEGYVSWWEWDLMSGCKGDLKGGWRSPVLPLYTCTETPSYIVKLSKHHAARPTHTRTHTHDECVMNPLEWKGASFPLLSERITCVLNILFFEKTKKKRPLKKNGGAWRFSARNCAKLRKRSSMHMMYRGSSKLSSLLLSLYTHSGVEWLYGHQPTIRALSPSLLWSPRGF